MKNERPSRAPASTANAEIAPNTGLWVWHQILPGPAARQAPARRTPSQPLNCWESEGFWTDARDKFRVAHLGGEDLDELKRARRFFVRLTQGLKLVAWGDGASRLSRRRLRQPRLRGEAVGGALNRCSPRPLTALEGFLQSSQTANQRGRPQARRWW